MFTATKYDAFISYSHQGDSGLATSLHRALERFAKPWYRRRETRVFHDTSGLNVTEALAPRLREIIRDSEHFLLLASPEAASSKWVEREVEARLEDERPIFIVLTAGEIVWDGDVGKLDSKRTTALPAALREHFAHEPLYVDLRWARKRNDLSLRDPRFHDAVATLAATIRGVDKDELSSLAITRHRQALRLAWSTVAVLLALLAGAIYQTVQASRARDLAHQRLKDAIDVSELIVFNIDTGLEPVAGAGEVRKTLLALGQDLIGRLRGSAAETTTRDADLDRMEVVNHQKRGILALSNDDLARAQHELEAAYAGARELVEERPTDSLYWQDMGHAAERLGTVYRLQGQYGKARTHLDHALDIATHLTEQKPHITSFRWELASVRSSRAKLERALGRFEAAEHEAQTALALEVELARAFQGEPRYVIAAAATRNLIGDMHLDQADPANAKRFYLEALELRRRLHEREPDDAHRTLDVASSHARVGYASLRLGELEAARQSLDAGLKLVDGLVRAEPENLLYLAQKATLLQRFGEVAQGRRDHDVARRHYLESLRLYDVLLERDDRSVDSMEQRISVLMGLGAIEYDREDIAAATEHYTGALAAAETLLALQPESARAKRLVMLGHDTCGNVAAVAEQPDEAKTHYMEALRWAGTLSAAHPESVQYRIDLSQVQAHLGDLALRVGEFPEGLRRCEEGLRIAREIMLPDPGVQVRRNLWSLLLAVAKAHGVGGNPEAGKEPCLEAIALCERLVESDPENAQYLAMLNQSKQFLDVLTNPDEGD